MAKENIKTLEELKAIVADAKNSGLTVVTTNGVFDVLHIGHTRYLDRAKEHGDMLVVGVNSDASVRRLKGPARPLVPCTERMEIIAALESVDYVFPFDEDTPVAWIGQLKPDVHVKGGDYKDLPERGAVERGGGRVVIVEKTGEKSTTNLIKKIISVCKG
ncbi:MAG: adenylyltransferase/cytidyltransferase family protein [Candidatus Aenigmarchaeota archaeon]|nr:adenylyltransferase/cytidyltransferase family protein [Candidatus Aenigmarchaeota archaeon]